MGAAGAVALRCVLTFAAVLLLQIPYIQAGGGILLLWIAFKLLLEEEDEVTVRDEGSSVWRSIRTILLADFVMSLDNVLAIAGIAKGDLALIVIGIMLSIPIVVWGSGLIVGWLHRFPVLVYIGAFILAHTAGICCCMMPSSGWSFRSSCLPTTPSFQLPWASLLS